MGFTAAIIAASVAVGTGATVYSSIESSKAQKKAGQLAEEQQNQQNALLTEAKNKQAADASQAEGIANRDAARLKQRQAAAAAQGRQDTILTGPLGVTGSAPGQAKTILGG